MRFFQIVRADADGPALCGALLRQRLLFYTCLVATSYRAAAYRWGGTGVDTQQLLLRFDAILQPLATHSRQESSVAHAVFP